jgi:hypothetical protein
VDDLYRHASTFVPAPTYEQSPHGSASRRPTIDPKIVAMTANWATNIDGDSFSRSFRMDAPLIPGTGEFKTWKRDFLSLLSMKGAALIPQLAMSSSGVPLNPVA